MATKRKANEAATGATVASVLAELAALGDEKVRARSVRAGGDANQFGVLSGDLRKLAKKLKTNHALALELWECGNMDARMLAILLLEPQKLTASALDRMVRRGGPAQVADWLNTYVVRQHPEKESLRESWMKDKHPWAARAGWALTSERIGKAAEGLDLAGLLDRIEREMPAAPPEVQWTMNFCLAGIGIHHERFRQRAMAIGEKLGIYRDYPVSKGCTSPFAPVWIEEMVRRKG